MSDIIKPDFSEMSRNEIRQYFTELYTGKPCSPSHAKICQIWSSVREDSLSLSYTGISFLKKSEKFHTIKLSSPVTGYAFIRLAKITTMPYYISAFNGTNQLLLHENDSSIASMLLLYDGNAAEMFKNYSSF